MHGYGSRIYNLIHVSYHGYHYKNGERKQLAIGSITLNYSCEDQENPYTLTAEDLREIVRDIEREKDIYDVGIIDIMSLPLQLQLPSHAKSEGQ